MESELMTPKEVAEAFRVDVKTVARWAKDGKISSTKTLGGHNRYNREEIFRLLLGEVSAESDI